MHRAIRRLLVVCLGAAAGCSTAPHGGPPSPPAAAARAILSVTADAAAPAVPPQPTASAAPAPPVASSTAISAASAEEILFGEGPVAPGVLACRNGAEDAARIRCLLALRFEGDPAAARVALDLYTDGGDLAGVEPDQQMDGGFRGTIHLVPEPPTGKYRRHLEWVAAAARDFDAFFTGITPPGSPAPRYRHRAIAYRFFRSVSRATPSAFADGWAVSYNVVGSLLVSATAVRETLFHEVFHLNDAGRGDWSARALRPVFDAVVARCGTKIACLRPYAPGETTVRGGTYYAFQPDNGDAVHEYAAELALRYYQEQRAALRGEKRGLPAFKCGPEENRRAWEAITTEFFAGIDRVPACRR